MPPRSVIISTGLVALVDDCIKQRWHVKKASRQHPPRSNTSDVADGSSSGSGGGARGLMSGIFHRRHSEHHTSSPLRFSKPVAAY